MGSGKWEVKNGNDSYLEVTTGTSNLQQVTRNLKLAT